MSACTPREAFNYVQGDDITNQSAYKIWLGLGNVGTEEDFLEFVRTGPKGDTGKSVYEEWVEQEGNEDKSFEDFMTVIKGPIGLSAYQIWLGIGNTGTESDFINAIKGATGPKGETGPQGLQGDTGPRGDQGPQGEQGKEGPQGVKGAAGEQGDQGPQGEKGDSGSDWNENPVNHILMRDQVTGTIYKVSMSNGSLYISEETV